MLAPAAGSVFRSRPCGLAPSLHVRRVLARQCFQAWPRTLPRKLLPPGVRLRYALQRGGKVRAIVQYVVNGARFKLSIPKENVTISFNCAGLRCPACARRDGGGLPAVKWPGSLTVS